MFSVVIPVFRNEGSIALLLETLEGLHRSMDGDLEAVFVVDGSPDRSLEALTEALPRSPFRLPTARAFPELRVLLRHCRGPRAWPRAALRGDGRGPPGASRAHARVPPPPSVGRMRGRGRHPRAALRPPGGPHGFGPVLGGLPPARAARGPAGGSRRLRLHAGLSGPPARAARAQHDPGGSRLLAGLSAGRRCPTNGGPGTRAGAPGASPAARATCSTAPSPSPISPSAS